MASSAHATSEMRSPTRTLPPSGRKAGTSPNSGAFDGGLFTLYVGEKRITFGLPLRDDLPPGVAALHALIAQLEYEQMKACLPACSAAKRTPTQCEPEPGCTVLIRWAPRS